jgi:uncharacterized membrane protein YkoI
MTRKNSLFRLTALTTGLLFATIAQAESGSGDNQDLDDVRNWTMVKIETCLDAALDRIPGNARKVELKLEDGDPVYEFDIESKNGGTYNVECNAQEGVIVEVEREVKPDDPTFKSLAKVSEEEARKFALAIHPGKVVANEYEIGDDGNATYEYDIQTTLGYEIKVDVDAATGEIEEANVELYEIGMEAE